MDTINTKQPISKQENTEDLSCCPLEGDSMLGKVIEVTFPCLCGEMPEPKTSVHHFFQVMRTVNAQVSPYVDAIGPFSKLLLFSCRAARWRQLSNSTDPHTDSCCRCCQKNHVRPYNQSNLVILIVSKYNQYLTHVRQYTKSLHSFQKAKSMGINSWISKANCESCL